MCREMERNYTAYQTYRTYYDWYSRNNYCPINRIVSEVKVEPATIGLLLAGATKCVDYLKQGIALGKDISDMSSQVSKFMQNTSEIEHMEKRP